MRLAWLVILLLAVPAAAQNIDVRCPNGVRFVGDPFNCPCCVKCPDGSWFLEGEGQACPEYVREEKNSASLGVAMSFSIIMILVSTVLYFVPSSIAWRRQHPQLTPIILLNLFLGWTLIGWVAALVWSTMAIEKRG